MHASTYISAAAAFATAVFAAPAPHPNLSKSIAHELGIKNLGFKPDAFVDRFLDATTQQQTCMPRADALVVAETFRSIIRGYTKEQALAALTPDFVDYSSAVSIIINKGGSEPEDIT